MIKGNRRVEEPEQNNVEIVREYAPPKVPVLSGAKDVIEEINQEIDDSNEAQINCYDLAPCLYPWEEVTADLGTDSSHSDVPNLYPETPPELTSNDEEDSEISEEDEVQIISPSETPPSRTRQEMRRMGFFIPPPPHPTDDGNSDNEVQILTGPIPTQGDVFINGRRYSQRTVMSRVRGSTVMRVQRRESDSSPEEEEENRTEANHNEFDDLIDSEEDEERERDTPRVVDEYQMRRDPNYREYERRRRRSRPSSSESDTDRRGNGICHSQYNPMLRTYGPPIRCPEVEELNSYVRQMIRMSNMAESDDSERTQEWQNGSCHCSSPEQDYSV